MIPTLVNLTQERKIEIKSIGWADSVPGTQGINPNKPRMGAGGGHTGL